MNQPIIWWIRRDLRLQDNPALAYAAQHGSVIPVFIEDSDAPAAAQLGGASKWWLHHSLQQLNASMDGQIRLFKGNCLSILQAIIEQTGATSVVWNRGYEPWQIARDANIKDTLSQAGVDVKSTNGHLLWEPMQVLKKDGTPYKVFTPYYRKGCLAKAEPRFPVAIPDITWYTQSIAGTVSLDALAFLPNIRWDSEMQTLWQPGSEGAQERLSRFIKEAASHYQHDRNLPGVKGTSQLSPHLHFGEISVNQVWYALKDAFSADPDNPDCDVFLSELGWREFSHYLLFHFPQITTDNFNPKFDAFRWESNPEHLTAWQKGQTGIPIIDAGMRELWRTGYMHNRVRMVVGSFLVKNLLIDWREGERWFWDCLLDADMAANSASWQWVAGTGADAAPYFRVFNPILQGEKFDKEGDYVKHYCPELRKLPPKFIHQPWAAPEAILKACDVRLGDNYPHPIVDLKQSREKALAAFQAMKEAS